MGDAAGQRSDARESLRAQILRGLLPQLGMRLDTLGHVMARGHQAGDRSVGIFNRFEREIDCDEAAASDHQLDVEALRFAPRSPFHRVPATAGDRVGMRKPDRLYSRLPMTSSSGSWLMAMADRLTMSSVPVRLSNGDEHPGTEMIDDGPYPATSLHGSGMHQTH